MGVRFYWLILGILADWRVTHLFTAEDGPWDVSVSLRRAAGDGFWGKLLDCFYCLSLWVAAPLAAWMGASWGERLLLWLAFSGGAILLDRLGDRTPQPPVYLEDETVTEDEHRVVLRKE